LSAARARDRRGTLVYLSPGLTDIGHFAIANRDRSLLCAAAQPIGSQGAVLVSILDPEFAGITNSFSARRGACAASAAAPLEAGVGQRRRGQPPRRPLVALHAAELVKLGFPRLPERHDLLVAAPDEVPPHDDVLLERGAAEQQHPRLLTAEVGEF